MKHDQRSVDWRKWDKTWTVKCGLKEIRWNKNETWSAKCGLKEMR